MNTVVIRQPDKAIQGRGQKFGYQTVVTDNWDLPSEKVLFVAKGEAVPWNLLAAGWYFLDKWEVAAPLWRYGVLAADVGTPAEQKITQAVTLDLRMLLYAHELLFVKNCDGARAFISAWLEECERGPEKRLAFLRALHRVKPIFCALPHSWLIEEAQRVAQDARSGLVSKEYLIRGDALSEVRPSHQPKGLVRVDIGNGRQVLCWPGEEEMVRARYQLQAMSRKERRALVGQA